MCLGPCSTLRRLLNDGGLTFMLPLFNDWDLSPIRLSQTKGGAGWLREQGALVRPVSLGLELESWKIIGVWGRC